MFINVSIGKYKILDIVAPIFLDALNNASIKYRTVHLLVKEIHISHNIFKNFFIFYIFEDF